MAPLKPQTSLQGWGGIVGQQGWEQAEEGTLLSIDFREAIRKEEIVWDLCTLHLPSAPGVTCKSRAAPLLTHSTGSEELVQPGARPRSPAQGKVRSQLQLNWAS